MEKHSRKRQQAQDMEWDVVLYFAKMRGPVHVTVYDLLRQSTVKSECMK